MLVLVRLASGRLFHLDFGSPVDGPLAVEPHVRWVLADYERRRDDLWDVPPGAGQEALTQCLVEAGDSPARLLPILDAMRFYSVPDPAALAIVPLLGHVDRNVRLYVLGALGSMAKYVTAKDIQPFLSSPDGNERLAAADALSKFGTRGTAESIRAAASADPSLLAAAQRADERCAIVEEGWVSGLVAPLLATEDYEDLCLYSPICVRRLVRFAEDASADLEQRRRALRVVGLTRQRKLAGKAALDIAADETQEPSLRRMAAWALGRMRDGRALPVFERVLPTSDRASALVIVEAIGRIGKARSLGYLLNRHSSSDDAEMRTAIGSALMRISRRARIHEDRWSAGSAVIEWVYAVTDAGALLTEDLTPVLLPELTSPDPSRRSDAIFALSLVAEQGSVDVTLREMAEFDPDEATRGVASAAILSRERRSERALRKGIAER